MSARLALKSSFALAIALAFAAPSQAGVFLNHALGKVTHDKNYNGVGGEIVVNVCLDPTAMPISGDPVQATENAIAEFNRFEPTLGNVTNAVAAGVPGGQVDYQSIVTHEIGHCIGLDHNVLGPSEAACSLGNAGSCNSSPTIFFTNALPNLGGLTTDDGLDNVRATGDDIRGDDSSLHWHRSGANNPFEIPAVADRTNHVQNLPYAVGDTFAEAATAFSPCTLGGLASNTSAANGQPATSSIMAPILCTNNVVRDLAPDDHTTFRIARAGFDNTAGTADDYTVRLAFQGTNQVGCDLRIRFPSGGGFFCGTSLFDRPNGDQSVGDNDTGQPYGTINLQRETNWFFNQVDTTQGGGGGDDCIFRNGFETGTNGCN